MIIGIAQETGASGERNSADGFDGLSDVGRSDFGATVSGEGSSMPEMLQQMMKEKQNGEGGMGDMKGMMKRMAQTSKMVDPCCSMMESAPGQSK